MYIDKWWNDSVGGTDDSMLLIDYFDKKDKREFTFREIVKDLHMDDVLGKRNAYFESGLEFYYAADSGDGSEMMHCDFDIAADVIIDLSALLLQCLVEGSVRTDSNITSEKQIEFTISAERDEIRLLAAELENIAQHLDLYYPDFLVDEFAECIEGIKEICDELQGFC